MRVQQVAFPYRHGRQLLVQAALVAPTVRQGRALVELAHLEATPMGVDPRHARCVTLEHMPLRLLSDASNVPLVPTQDPRLPAVVRHARRDPTPLRQEQHRAQSAHEVLTYRTQGLQAP